MKKNDFPFDGNYDDDDYEENDKEIEQLVKDFKNKIRNGNHDYFDDDETEAIILYAFRTFDFTLADHALEYAIKTFPSDSYFRILKVRRHMIEFDAENAEKELENIRKMFAPSGEYYLQKALLMKMKDDNSDVIPILNKAELLDPESPEILFMLASEHLRLGNVKKAFTYAERSINIDPSMEEQLFSFSLLFDETKKYDNAIEFFTMLTNSFPLSTDAWGALALAYSANNEHEKAIEANQYVLSIDDTISPAYYNIGNSYFELEQFDKALENYTAAYNLDNRDFFALTCMGDCHYVRNETDKAMECYQRARDLNPEYMNAITGILSILNDAGKYNETEIFIEKLFNSDIQSVGILFTVLSFYKAEMQPETMKRLFNTAFEHSPEKTAFFAMFAQFCCHCEEYELGINLLSDYLDEEFPNNPYYMAAFHYLNQNFAEGAKYLQIALLTNYENVEMFMQLDPVLSTYDEIVDMINMYKP
ncbi:MAG: tetratricopeptide repeat protein [Bacteroidales bacterium]|nr:tetratricopeptide repeat protein [Bacteroidales bacterium]